MRTVFFGLGSNRGDRMAHLQAAVDKLSCRDDLRLVGASDVYETEAHTLQSQDEQPAFLNAVLEVETRVTPAGLLHTAQKIEESEGRRRGIDQERWGPRTLDIDLLAVGNLTRRTDSLNLPHPRLAERRFVLLPWADLAPDFFVPAPFSASVRTLLETCSDSATVRETDYILTLPAGSGS